MIDYSGASDDRLNSRRWWLLPALCTLALMWLLHAELWFTSTIPASHDMTGHLLPIAELRNRLLPDLRVHGWSGQWFAGFPVFYFYFPVPALLAALLSALVGLEVALKLTSVLGLLVFPAAVYTLLRACRTSRAQAAIATVIASLFLTQSFWYLGANVASTVAGEFSYSISFSLSLFYLATLLRASSGFSAALVPALLLAAVALSHLVTTIVVVLVAAVLLLQPQKRQVVLLSWVLGFLLSAFWTVPFLVRRGELAAVYQHAQRTMLEFLPIELWAVAPAAVAGLLLIRRQVHLRPVLFMSLAGIVLYVLAGRVVYPGRFLPYWFLGVHTLAGLAVAHLLLARSARTTLFAVALLLPVVVLHVGRGTGWLRDASYITYGGLERRPAWAEVRSLMQRLPADGAVYWEDSPLQLTNLGSRHIGAITPYLAPGVRVLNGLWIESTQLQDELLAIAVAVGRMSGSAPTEAEQQMRQVLARLADLGASRFVALNYATADLLRRAGAQPVFASEHLALFEFAGAPRIEVQQAGLDAQIVEWSDERIRFRTQAVGTPHLVRMSYFPNWRADGATLQRGRHSMMLVTPTRHEVTLAFAPTWVERTGAGITLVTWLGLIGTVWLLRRRRGAQVTATRAEPAGVG